ncbi:MAG: YfiT family bacillithiol transferase [Terriglobales bacterium]
MNDETLRYPIGRFQSPACFTAAGRGAAIQTLREAPVQMRELTARLSEPELERRYRPDGWTIRQVAHHVPDSHLNAYVRMKLALTEDAPTVKAYDEAAWARLPDSAAPVAASLDLLDALHRRWVALLESLTEAQFRCALRHSEMGLMSLDQVLALYAWHSRHHLAHVRAALMAA